MLNLVNFPVSNCTSGNITPFSQTLYKPKKMKILASSFIETGWRKPIYYKPYLTCST